MIYVRFLMQCLLTDDNGKIENIWQNFLFPWICRYPLQVYCNLLECSFDNRSLGVVDQHPVILPKTSSEYSSACPLYTPSSRIECDIEMKHMDIVGSVEIAPFAVSTQRDEMNLTPF